MGDYKFHEVAVNFELMRRFGFYQMFDPNGAKVYGSHSYRVACIMVTAVVQLVFVYATFGFFVGTDDAVTDIELVLCVSIHLENLINLTKVCVMLYNVTAVWRLFDVTRMAFLTSEPCRERIETLRDDRGRSLRLTNVYSAVVSFAVVTQWVIFPIIYNVFIVHEPSSSYSSDDDAYRRRSLCIFNLRFPVTVRTHGRYYAAFYAMETVVALFFWYVNLFVDVFVMSFCWVMTAQYNVLMHAFKDVGHENERTPEEDYARFESILFDQQKLFLKLKSFYTVMKPIILIFVALQSILIITGLFSFTVICMSGKVVSLFDLIKIGTTVLFLCAQLFLYCYLFENLNNKKDLVNFGIYSCNWTKMNVKFKKLLLLTMRLNDANKITMQASLGKIINMQLFSNIMKASYNTVSVLTRVTYKKDPSKK